MQDVRCPNCKRLLFKVAEPKMGTTVEIKCTCGRFVLVRDARIPKLKEG